MSRRTDDMGYVLEYLESILDELRKININHCDDCDGDQEVPLYADGVFQKMIPCPRCGIDE